jgi:peptidoglycan/LPS O-acetylase OafA/YrhL
MSGDPGLTATPGHKDYLYGLDLVRFSAALMVLSLHLTVWGPTGGEATVDHMMHNMKPEPMLSSIFDFGWIGVDVFFVLSGFVIAYSAEGSRALDFLRRRALRLLPGAWVAATLSLAVLLALGIYPRAEILTRYWHSLTFWPTGPWTDGAYWTLPIELCFYLLVFLTLAARQFRHVELLAAILGLASTAYWAVGFQLFPVYWWLGLTQLGSELLVQNGCAFALGVFLWLILTREWTWLRGALAVILAGGVTLEILHTSSNHAEVLHVADPGPVAPLAVFFLSMAAIIASVRFHRQIQSALGPRTARWVRRLGLATYPLYLLHTVSGGAALYALTMAGVPRVLAFVLACAVSIALGLLVAVGPEPWLRKRLAALLGATNPRPVEGTGTA